MIMILFVTYLKMAVLTCSIVCVVGAYLYFYGKEVNFDDDN